MLLWVKNLLPAHCNYICRPVWMVSEIRLCVRVFLARAVIECDDELGVGGVEGDGFNHLDDPVGEGKGMLFSTSRGFWGAD